MLSNQSQAFHAAEGFAEQGWENSSVCKSPGMDTGLQAKESVDSFVDSVDRKIHFLSVWRPTVHSQCVPAQLHLQTKHFKYAQGERGLIN